MRQIPLARSPEDPQFGISLIKLVIELRNDRRLSLGDAMARALRGMRVDREAFYRHVMANPERYKVAAAQGAPMRRLRLA